ncbi:hypothetical protein Tco_0270772 [Tanacetum coccineum]
MGARQEAIEWWREGSIACRLWRGEGARVGRRGGRASRISVGFGIGYRYRLRSAFGTSGGRQGWLWTGYSGGGSWLIDEVVEERLVWEQVLGDCEGRIGRGERVIEVEFYSSDERSERGSEVSGGEWAGRLVKGI